MSFRTRLTLFFVLIVVLTMVAVGVVVFRLIEDSQSGKADARVSAFASDAIHRYRDAANQARIGADRVAADPQLGRALGTRDARVLRRRAATLLQSQRLVRFEITRGGRNLLLLGEHGAVAAEARTITFTSGRGPGASSRRRARPRALRA